MEPNSFFLQLIGALAVASVTGLVSWMLSSMASDRSRETQDIRHTKDIERLNEKVSELRGDYKEEVKLLRERDRELELAQDESDRRFRSLVGFLSSKGLHYRIRGNDKETLS